MSRTHLYRASGPAKPLASIVLATLFVGASFAILLATAPHFLGGLPLGGPAAGVIERLFAVLAGSALALGLGIAVSELIGGKTLGRGMRLGGGVALAIVGVIGMADTARRIARPGTPASSVAGMPETTPLVPEASAALSGQRLLWSVAGTAAALLVVIGGLGAIRRWDRMT